MEKLSSKKTTRQPSEFYFEVMKDFDYVLEEGQNTAICCRKISWNGRDPKVDIRKYTYKDGEEIMGKGISITDDGCDALTDILTKNGYGDTTTILKNLVNRKDFSQAINSYRNKNQVQQIDDELEGYYDPSELIE